MEAVMRSHGRLELARLRKLETMAAVFEDEGGREEDKVSYRHWSVPVREK